MSADNYGGATSIFTNTGKHLDEITFAPIASILPKPIDTPSKLIIARGITLTINKITQTAEGNPSIYLLEGASVIIKEMSDGIPILAMHQTDGNTYILSIGWHIEKLHHADGSLKYSSVQCAGHAFDVLEDLA